MENAISQTDTLTTLSLVLIAVLALLTIAGIVWGARLKRKRVEASRIEQERIETEAPNTASETASQPIEEVETSAAPTPPVVRTAETPAPVAPTPPPRGATPERVTPLDDEPIAAAAPQDASPASEATVPATEAPSEAPVTVLKGLGPKVAARLAELGVTRVGEIAALDDDDAAALDAQLGPFRGRMARDRWVEQARFLAAGDRAGFEAVFGKL